MTPGQHGLGRGIAGVEFERAAQKAAATLASAGITEAM